MSGRPRDLDRLFDALAQSRFRSRFALGPTERRYLAARGEAVVLEHAREFVARRLAPAAPRNDGRQTPFRGHPVFVAQHATATCCRGCLSKWHGIDEGRPLTADEQARVVAAIARWLENRAAEEQPQAAPDGVLSRQATPSTSNSMPGTPSSRGAAAP